MGLAICLAFIIAFGIIWVLEGKYNYLSGSGANKFSGSNWKPPKKKQLSEGDFLICDHWDNPRVNHNWNVYRRTRKCFHCEATDEMSLEDGLWYVTYREEK